MNSYERVGTDTYSRRRVRMVEVYLRGRGITNEMVLRAMESTPRHLFVDEALQNRAYEDYSLPIGYGQTISQPYIVARMSEALGLTGTEKVLEIGTGSGYQTAVLARLAAVVFSIERIPGLAEQARRALSALEYDNVVLRVGDGSAGWLEEGPFDAIAVSACAPKLPQTYLGQLAEGGRLVLPIGNRHRQQLMRYRRTGTVVEEEVLRDCQFVRLIGVGGW